MTAAHVDKIIGTEACPCCKAPRSDLVWRHGVTHYARADFECGASFLTANGRITVGNACQDASILAAHLWNLQLQGRATPPANPPQAASPACGNNVDEA